MSSTYSGDRGDGTSTRASTKSIGQVMQWTQAWIADGPDRSSASSAISSSSDQSSNHDDLDLDSLFKRLDKYTAEMQEVEERLKRARSNSEKSDGLHLKHFSFEDRDARDEDKASSPSTVSRTSSRASQRRRSPHGGSDENSGPAPIKLPKSPARSSRTSSRHTSLSRSLSEAAPAVDGAGKEAPTALHTPSQPQEEQENSDDPPRRVFGDWKVWAEQTFHSEQPVQERPSSKYSESAESFQDTPNPNFVWKRMSPSPPLKDIRRTPTLRKARVSDPDTEESAQSARDYHEYSSEDDEPGPSVPTSWALPPRSSSRRVMSDESFPPRSSSKSVLSGEVVQEQDILPPRPAPRRRMTTSDGRPSIRNGGFWSDHGSGLFGEEALPPVPALSASNSNATLILSPPLTPLTISDPREDQLRRELETFSIQDGAEALEHRYKKRRPPMLNLLDSDEDNEDFTPIATPLEPDHSSLFSEDDERNLRPRPRPRRRKSLFSIFQRKSPVEKLIDMYFDDEPEEKPIPRRRSTWSRKGSPVQENMPKSPAIPAQFQAHGAQTSI